MLSSYRDILSRFSPVFWRLVIILALPSISHAGATFNSEPASSAVIGLNQKRIHAKYNEGDFEGVVASIDSFTVTHKTFSLDDSVFIAKHLAVVYAANPATREKGKNYMFRLLDLMPSAKIVDMFVSDEIDHIFTRVREEFVIREQANGRDVPTNLASHQYASNRMTVTNATLPDAHSVDKKKPALRDENSSSKAFYWVAGSITVAAVTGASIYFLMPKKTSDKTYDLP